MLHLLTGLPALRELHVRSNGWTQLGDHPFVTPERMPLIASRHSFLASFQRHVEAALPSLQLLDLGDNQLSSWQEVRARSHYALSEGSCRCFAAQIDGLGARFPNLQTLILSDNRLGDLVTAPRLPQLTSISLSYAVTTGRTMHSSLGFRRLSSHFFSTPACIRLWLQR